MDLPKKQDADGSGEEWWRGSDRGYKGYSGGGKEERRSGVGQGGECMRGILERAAFLVAKKRVELRLSRRGGVDGGVLGVRGGVQKVQRGFGE